MDPADIYSSISFGLVNGLVASLTITAAILPASFVMNKFIHHTGSMRTLMGAIALSGSVLSMIALLIYRLTTGSRPHYFGLLPMILETNADATDVTLLRDLPQYIWRMIVDPLCMFYTSEADVTGYASAVDNMLAAARGDKPLVDTAGQTFTMRGSQVIAHRGCVSEELFAEARRIGSLSTGMEWGAAVEDAGVKAVGEYIFQAS